MNALSYSDARANLSVIMKSVCDNHDPVIITRHNADSVVMLSLEDYNSLCETNYLLNSKNNAMRLIESINELSAGFGTEQALTH